MKYKIIAFVLALATMSWTQTATTDQNSASGASSNQSEVKAACPCCQKMAEAKDAQGCCVHHQDKDSAGCCSGKGGKACMKAANSKSDCKDGKCCGGNDKKCCADTAENAVMACCGKKCSMDHPQHDIKD
jgi:hypothetical protein